MIWSVPPTISKKSLQTYHCRVKFWKTPNFSQHSDVSNIKSKRKTVLTNFMAVEERWRSPYCRGWVARWLGSVGHAEMYILFGGGYKDLVGLWFSALLEYAPSRYVGCRFFIEHDAFRWALSAIRNNILKINKYRRYSIGSEEYHVTTD